MSNRGGHFSLYAGSPVDILLLAKKHRAAGEIDVVVQFCWPVGKSSDNQWVVGVGQGWESSDEDMAVTEAAKE